MGTGLAYGWIKGSGTLKLTSTDPGSDTTLTYKGWGPAYELLIGGTVTRGFVLGGGVVGQRIWDPEVTSKYSLRVRSDSTFDDLGEGGINIGLIGAFLDWFPDEAGGLHWGTMVGFALLGLTQGHIGVAGSLWSGYDFWISSAWTLGIQARLVASRCKHGLSGYSGTLDDNAINAALLFTALYHQ
jgi:hypothetical protein